MIGGTHLGRLSGHAYAALKGRRVAHSLAATGSAPFYGSSMSIFATPPAAVPAEIPRRVPLQIVSPCAEPLEGDGWLHEVKHDGHGLLAITAAQPSC